ncbi:MAG TPA: hypothetical protein VIJ66_08135 [Solirubrobacteraceae bacterium]
MTPPSASAAAAAPAIHPRRTTGPRRAPATRRPRRVSGPVNPTRGRGGSIPNGARPQERAWTGPLRAVGLAEAVATRRLLDRLIRGRVWIGVIAFALIGIVTMQLVLLKLNAGIGRSLVREALLQRENTTLSAENSEVGAGEQVEARAERDGMELIPAGALRFLTVRPSSDVSKAVAALSAPVSTATSGEGSAPSTPSAGEAAITPSATSTGEANAQPAATTEAAATPSPPAATTETPPAASTESPAATTTETQASGASTATSTAGASEAAATSTETPSAATSTGGTGG